MGDSLQLDLTGLLAAHVGPKGVSTAEIETVSVRLEEIRQELAGLTHGTPLAFLDLPTDSEKLSAIASLSQDLRPGHRNLLLIAIGGSASGTLALAEALQSQQSAEPASTKSAALHAFYLDNVDPEQCAALLRSLDPRETLINVVSKSGSTPESLANFMIAFEWCNVPGIDRTRNFIVTTEPNSIPMAAISREMGLRILPIPGYLSGRYSILSPVALFPLALLGGNASEVAEGAASITRAARMLPAMTNPVLVSAALFFLSLTTRDLRSTILMPYCGRLRRVAEWWKQLWGETLGKRLDVAGGSVGVGSTPVTAIGAIDQHSLLQLMVDGPDDKVTTFIKVISHGDDLMIPEAFPNHELCRLLGGNSLAHLLNTECDATAQSLLQQGRPHRIITLPRLSPYHIGQLVQFFQIETFVIARLLGVEPFSQPGVEESKSNTLESLKRPGLKGYRPGEPTLTYQLAE